MKQSPRSASGQFTLPLKAEPDLHHKEPHNPELLKALADLLLEALGGEGAEERSGKERNNES